MEKEKELTKIGVMTYLSDLGYDRIMFRYSGGGDSGDIEEPILIKPGEDPHALEYIDSKERRKPIMRDALDFIKTIVDKRLGGDDVEDWWNNDGGFGNIVINIPSGTYDINNNVYFSNSEYYHHEGELENE